MASDFQDALAHDASRLSVKPLDTPSTEEQTPTQLSTNSTRLQSSSIASKDITNIFTSAASALHTGQLVKDEYFTLFEAVGALEIMDPKMDSGYLVPNEQLEDEYDVSERLGAEDVVGIMDRMLCCEMAWHQGHPLSQTLFTSIHIDHLLWPIPKTLDHANFDRGLTPARDIPMVNLVLRAYSLGTIKTCDYVHRRISAETYYEEEDFVTNLYHRSLLTTFESTGIESLLTEAAIWLERSETSDGLRKALSYRLESRKALLKAVALDMDVCNEGSNPHWKKCDMIINQLLETKALGHAADGAFSAKTQRRLASTVPPRPMVNINLEDACAHLHRMCTDGEEMLRILDYQGSNNLLTFVSTFQARQPQPSVYNRCLLQSLVFNEMKVLGRISIKQLILDDLGEIVLPADKLVDPANDEIEVAQDPRFEISRRMDQFIGRVGQSYIDIVRALSMNRSRMRRMLCHTIVDWDTIQLDAEEIDTELRPLTQEIPIRDSTPSGEDIWRFPLSSWAFYHKLHLMEWIVQLGFELKIYQTGEIAGMYWYLQYLANTRVQHLHRIETFTTRCFNTLPKLSPAQIAAFPRSSTFLSFAKLEASATQSFALALSLLYTTLTHLSLLSSPTLPYSTHSLRYSLRMRPFLPISIPAVPSYAEFAGLVSPFASAPRLFTNHPTTSQQAPTKDPLVTQTLTRIELLLKQSRKEWETIAKAPAEMARCRGCEDAWRAGVKNVQRSVIMAGIAVAGVRKWVEGGRERGEMLVVDVGENGNANANAKGNGKGYHDWWDVPRLSVVKNETGHAKGN